ncbi:mitochondrial basic amino acids transporter-like [Polistes fuscatus]|uniref:mitochondrial basic amino acids transporter-like n=1 Tax=Polistes fuscatus TaxID=30207 RepID=UPI001CA9298E|nr:mitochondrial basic amino acids transporter-like [Polistes fuscatus]
MALDFAAGCLGGCAGIMVGYPLDTVKVHMQTQDNRNPKYKGTLHCLQTLIKKESVSGLYRGMTSPMAGVAVVNAIIFGVYGQSQKHMSDKDRLSYHFVAGAMAGIAQSPISSLIELAKTRMQLQSSTNKTFSGPMKCLKHIYKKEGFRGVFNGLGITFLREAPSFGTYFLTYEFLTQSKEPISTGRMLLAGGLAGTASWIVSYPLDVIKSRIQAESNNRYNGTLDCYRKSVRSEGYSCLYRGLNSTIIRAFPTNAMTFAVVTWTFRFFGEQRIETSNTEKLLSTYESFVGSWVTFLDNANCLGQTNYHNVTITAAGWMLRDVFSNNNNNHHDGSKKLWSKFDIFDQRTRECYAIQRIHQMNDREHSEMIRTELTDSKDLVIDNNCNMQCPINASGIIMNESI